MDIFDGPDHFDREKYKNFCLLGDVSSCDWLIFEEKLKKGVEFPLIFLGWLDVSGGVTTYSTTRKKKEGFFNAMLLFAPLKPIIVGIY